MLKKLWFFMIFSCFFVSVACADSPYDGWWFDSARSGTGTSVEVQGNTLFSATYTYLDGVPIWYTSVCEYDAGARAYVGKIQLWTNGADSMLPANPVSIEAGSTSIKFITTNQAELTIDFTVLGATETTSVDLVKFMPVVSPGLPDNRVLGWWYDTSYNGMGFFLEAYGDTLFGAWYLYPENGNSTDYGTWLTFTGQFQGDSRTFAAPLLKWTGGTGWEGAVYSSPTSEETNSTISFSLEDDGTLSTVVSQAGSPASAQAAVLRNTAVNSGCSARSDGDPVIYPWVETRNILVTFLSDREIEITGEVQFFNLFSEALCNNKNDVDWAEGDIIFEYTVDDGKFNDFWLERQCSYSDGPNDYLYSDGKFYNQPQPIPHPSNYYLYPVTDVNRGAWFLEEPSYNFDDSGHCQDQYDPGDNGRVFTFTKRFSIPDAYPTPNAQYRVTILLDWGVNDRHGHGCEYYFRAICDPQPVPGSTEGPGMKLNLKLQRFRFGR